MSDSHLDGGWSKWNFTLTPEAQGVFAKALHGFTGVGYTPLAFATQVVNGTNYSFLAQGKVIVPGTPEIAAKIHIFVPASGKGDPHLRQIIEIAP